MESLTSLSSPYEHCCVRQLQRKWTSNEQQNKWEAEQELMYYYGKLRPSLTRVKGALKEIKLAV